MDTRTSSAPSSPRSFGGKTFDQESKPAQTFRFTVTQSKIDFRSLGRLNIEKIRQEMDVDAMQSLLSNVAFSIFDAADVSSQTDDSICQLVRYMQTCLQYMLFVQLSQGRTIDSLSSERGRMEALLRQRDNEIEMLKTQLKAEKHAAHTLRNTMPQTVRSVVPYNTSTIIAASGIASDAAHSLVFRCDMCSKAFRSREFLIGHLERRHPGSALLHELLATVATPAPVASSEDSAAAELRAQRELLARELAARNAQLNDALASSRSLAAAAMDQLGASRTAVPLTENKNDANLLMALTTALSSITSQTESRFSDLKTELSNLRSTLGSKPSETTRDGNVVLLQAIQQQMAELENTVSRELANNRAILSSHAGVLLDDGLEGPTEAPPVQKAGLTEEEILRIAKTASMEQMHAIQQQISQLQSALLSSENARHAAELYAKSLENRPFQPIQATPLKSITPPAKVETPLLRAVSVPAPIPAPAPAPITIVTATSGAPFVLTYQWQRLPESTEGWNYPAPQKSLASLPDAQRLLPEGYKHWLRLLPASIMVSSTKPPRVKLPTQWEADLEVPNGGYVRVMMNRTETVQNIREDIAKKLSVPIAAIKLLSTRDGNALLPNHVTCEEADLLLYVPRLHVIQPLGDDEVNRIVSEYVSSGSPQVEEAVGIVEDNIVEAAKESLAKKTRPQLPQLQVDEAAIRAEVALAMRRGSALEMDPASVRDIQAAVSESMRTSGPAPPSPAIQRLKDAGQQLQKSIKTTRANLADVVAGKTLQTRADNPAGTTSGSDAASGKQVRPEKVAALKQGVLFAAKFILESSVRSASRPQGTPRSTPNLKPEAAVSADAMSTANSEAPNLPKALRESAEASVLAAAASDNSSGSAAPPQHVSLVGDLEDDVDESVGLHDTRSVGESVQDHADLYEAQAHEEFANDELGEQQNASPSQQHDSSENLEAEASVEEAHAVVRDEDSPQDVTDIQSPDLVSTLGNTQISDLTNSQFLSPVSHSMNEDTANFRDHAEGQEESLALSRTVDESLADNHLLSTGDLQQLPLDSFLQSTTDTATLSEQEQPRVEQSFSSAGLITEEEIVKVLMGPSRSITPAPSGRGTPRAEGAALPSSRPPSVAPPDADLDEIEEEYL